MSHKIGLITAYNGSIENDKDPCELPTNTIFILVCVDKSI